MEEKIRKEAKKKETKRKENKIKDMKFKKQIRLLDDRLGLFKKEWDPILTVSEIQIYYYTNKSRRDNRLYTPSLSPHGKTILDDDHTEKLNPSLNV